MKTSSLAATTSDTRTPLGLIVRSLIRQAILLSSRAGHDEGYVMIRATGPAGGFLAFLGIVLYVLLRYHVFK